MAQEDLKTKPGPRRINPDGSPGEEEPKKRPRFNIYWVYGLIFAFIVGWNFLRTAGSGGVKTDSLKFYEMVKLGDVDKFKTIRNKKLTRVFINKDSLQKRSSWYRGVFGKEYESVLKKQPAPGVL